MGAALPALFANSLGRVFAPLEARRAICQLEAGLHAEALAGSFIPADYPLLHTFLDGHYYRSIFLPAGHTVIGRLHRHECFNWITKGRVAMFTEAGGLELLEGPCSMLSPAGTKRALHILEDTIWTVRHKVTTTDLQAIEHSVIAESYTAMGLEDPVLEGYALERN